jgi:CheY-like chemotaxis protein
LNYDEYKWNKEKFLIADDDIYSCMLLEKILTKTGAQVVCAGDGQKAIDIIKTDPGITMAILDILMPKLSGNEVVELAQTLRPDLLFIACTADVFRLNREICEELGFFNCILKPFLPVKLFKVICEGISQREHIQSG